MGAKRTDAREGFESLSTEVARNTLLSLNVLFAIFLIVDAPSLWHGVAPARMDTQSYVHQGAIALGVAGLMVAVVVAEIYQRGMLRGAARKLAYLWIGQSFVLSAADLRRVQIHVHLTGLSD